MPWVTKRAVIIIGIRVNGDAHSPICDYNVSELKKRYVDTEVRYITQFPLNDVVSPMLTHCVPKISSSFLETLPTKQCRAELSAAL